MNDVLNYLEKAIDEMTEAVGKLIELVTAGDETARNYIEIFTAAYTDFLVMYGLMYSETQHTNE